MTRSITASSWYAARAANKRRSHLGIVPRLSTACHRSTFNGQRSLRVPGLEPDEVERCGGVGLAQPDPVIPPVLCYHKIERRRELGVTRLSPSHFTAQVHALAQAGWRGMSLRDFVAVVRGDRRAAANELLITFDDAYRGLRDYAFPVLRDVGYSAVCFVITDFAGRLNRWDVAYGGRRFAHLAWRDIETWSARGIAFGSHTATHPRLSWVDDVRLYDELERSRLAMNEALGDTATAISYPFGAVDARVIAAAVRCGYTAGFTIGGRWAADALRIPRHAVHCWSPLLPVVGPLGRVERAVSTIASRFAVGTSLWQRAIRDASLHSASEG
jgi:peptidoglycan/xylan/chitin deacetylase (PgdA/CDA1 family)